MINHSQYGAHIRSRYIACVLVAASLMTASCSDVSMNPATPTKVDSANVSFSAESETVIPQPVNNPFCPSVPPFDVPFVLVVRPNGVPGLVVTRILMQFTDSVGMRMPSVTVAAPLPTTQFGTALAQSRPDQRFALRMGVGCGVGRAGTIVIQIETRDAQGRSGSGRVSVNVR